MAADVIKGLRKHIAILGKFFIAHNKSVHYVYIYI